jgi:hypothetical protein
MAGLGRKVFTAGDVLTASDVQNYLMDQTVMNFAGTAARSSAIATPTTGMTTYNQTTQQLETYNGSAYIGMSGLQLIKKQTIGSAVSSVTVTGAFSATYENYKIIVSGGVGSAAGVMQLQIGAATTNYYANFQNSNYASTTVSNANTNNGANFIYAGGMTTNGMNLNLDLGSPFLNKLTTLNSSYVGLLPGASGSSGAHNGFLNDTTSYTSFTIFASTGTFTGGTIYVYGYGT